MVSSPSMVAPLKNSTRLTLPNGSEAVAVMPTVAGAVKVAPFAGCVRPTVGGEFTGVERKSGRRGGVFDKVSFVLELTDEESGTLTARVTNSWLFLRSAP